MQAAIDQSKVTLFVFRALYIIVNTYCLARDGEDKIRGTLLRGSVAGP